MKTASILLAGLVVAFDAGAQGVRAEASAAEPQATGFQVVINGANPIGELSIKEIQRIFYKKSTHWSGWQEDGKVVAVTPIDRERGAEVRRIFSKAVFNKTASAIESYWQRQIFSGDDIPPERLATEQDVLEFVSRHRGAIGYVSEDAVLGKDVKRLKIID